MSFMRSGKGAPVNVRLSPGFRTWYLDVDDSGNFVLPPPPPLPPEPGASWDFFEPIDDSESFRFMPPDGLGMDFEKLRESLRLQDKGADDSGVGINESDVFHDAAPMFKSTTENWAGAADLSCRSRNDRSVALVSSVSCSRLIEAGNENQLRTECSVNAPLDSSQGTHSYSEKEKPLLNPAICAATEDPSEFIMHRAKDFLSSIKDIEHKFLRVSESGKEVSGMLEGNKIRVGYPEEKVPGEVGLNW